MIGDAAHRDPVGAFAHLVGNDILVDRIVEVDRVGLHERQLHVAFLPAQKVDRALVLPVVPLLEVDAGPIPDVEYLAAYMPALWGTL